jgi:hypothetical protein
MTMTPAPPPLPPRPVRSKPAQRKGPLTPLRLLIGVAGLLAAAYYIGEQGGSADGTPPSQAVAKQETLPAAKPSAVVLKGEKPTQHRTVDQARMTLTDGGNTLRIEGGVGRDFARQLDRLLAENPSLQRIDITSGGGYTMIGFEAARIIQRRNLIVRVKSHCASICVALWAAAAQRQLEPDAVIGLHQWTAQCEVMPSPEREQCQHQAQFATDNTVVYEAWLRSAGFNAFLLDLQARTPPEDIAVVNAQQLRANGVDFVLVAKAS